MAKHCFAVFLALLVGAGIRGAAQSSVATQPSAGAVDDWPQWRGLHRDGISAETGLLDRWPSSGPPLVWSAAGLGPGYGSVALDGDRVFLQMRVGQQSAVASLDRDTGRILWSRVIGRGLDNDRGPGPRGTPTVDGDRLHVLTENGDLASLDIEDGSLVWTRNILADFGARNISWLISESPLVEGEKVIVTPGGPEAGMVALDKMSGATIWTSRELSDPAGYASVIAADVGGIRTLMTLTSRAGVGIRASDGKLMWRYPRVANSTANAATPVFHDDKVFYTSGYNTGAALLGLRRAGAEVEAEEIYFTRSMQNHHGGVVLVDGYLYGFHDSILTCLDFETGERIWRDRSVGKGSLTYADGHLYILGENNVVGLVEATPEGYREKGRFQIDDQGLPTWAHPVVAGGRLYLRNRTTLAAYDVRASR